MDAAHIEDTQLNAELAADAIAALERVCGDTSDCSVHVTRDHAWHRRLDGSIAHEQVWRAAIVVNGIPAVGFHADLGEAVAMCTSSFIREWSERLYRSRQVVSMVEAKADQQLLAAV